MRFKSEDKEFLQVGELFGIFLMKMTIKDYWKEREGEGGTESEYELTGCYHTNGIMFFVFSMVVC